MKVMEGNRKKDSRKKRNELGKRKECT